jgi:hypothetical protein
MHCHRNLFDHLVDTHQEGFRDHQRERFRGLEIDDQFDPGRLLDWKIGWLSALEDLIDLAAQ